MIDHQKTWDVIVIGAGPAGSTLALQLARAGRAVLLVDRSKFPREKVCGGCLSGRGIQQLAQLQLSHVVEEAIPLKSFHWRCAGRSVRLANTGVAISRGLFDARLAREAEHAGVTFLQSTTAKLGEAKTDFRDVHIGGPADQQVIARAKIVVVASGLGSGSSVGRGELIDSVHPDSLIGMTALLSSQFDLAPGEIEMAVSSDGYVGMVILEDGRVNVSAAVTSDSLRRHRDPSSVVTQILQQAGRTVGDEFSSAEWTGTRPLTRHMQQPFGDRLFVVGDAAGYVEPFTGQGMTWAIHSSRWLTPTVLSAVDAWDNQLGRQWADVLRSRMKQQQRTCRLVAGLIRRPWLVSTSIMALQMCPPLSRPLLHSIHGSMPRPPRERLLRT